MADRPDPKSTPKRGKDATTKDLRNSHDSLHVTETFQTILDNNKDNNITLPAAHHKRHPEFLSTLTHLSQTLFKFVSLTTGKPHPYCPESVLRYHLLTSTQLDDIARHYHQIWPPVPETYRYPKPIKAWIGTEEEHTIDIERKRERIGQFIGLRRGVPRLTTTAATGAIGVDKKGSQSELLGTKCQSADVNDAGEAEGQDVVKVICERLKAQMQKDWEEALEGARRDEGYSGIVRLTKA